MESVTKFAIKHGQAVTVGMDIANTVALKLKMIDEKLFKKMRDALFYNYPEYDFNSMNIDKYFEALSKDKKNEGSNIGCILPINIGYLVKKQLPITPEFKKIISTYFENAANIKV